MENKVFFFFLETYTPYLHPYQILHIFEEACGKFIHHIIMHESAKYRESHIITSIRLCIIAHNREFKKTKTAKATGKLLNKRFNEHNNSRVHAL